MKSQKESVAKIKRQQNNRITEGKDIFQWKENSKNNISFNPIHTFHIQLSFG